MYATLIKRERKFKNNKNFINKTLKADCRYHLNRNLHKLVIKFMFVAYLQAII